MTVLFHHLQGTPYDVKQKQLFLDLYEQLKSSYEYEVGYKHHTL